jgi:hypothetical protein
MNYRILIEGACDDVGGICDYFYQCTGKVTDKVNRVEIKKIQ